ncbi:hypothetical protein [Flavobacterium ardleyense]|uniref:hypothetical protein n=1 Tax=Flavobacterium ardleyense TaxID=2038737 RepID=UPI00298BE5DD|nr:hypothetical protein [Flavobacterium ardleyense]
MTLEEHIDNLPKDKRFDIAIRLTRLTLAIWNNYADKNELTYHDTVVGLLHSVDRTLLKKTIDAVEKYILTNRINKAIIKNFDLIPFSRQFSDPILALQDSDWELPYEVERTFYAVHNLLVSALGKEKSAFNETTIYVTINQAIDALSSAELVTETEIREILYDNKVGL